MYACIYTCFKILIKNSKILPDINNNIVKLSLSSFDHKTINKQVHQPTAGTHAGNGAHMVK